jgi:hypothetical protein
MRCSLVSAIPAQIQAQFLPVTACEESDCKENRASRDGDALRINRRIEGQTMNQATKNATAKP